MRDPRPRISRTAAPAAVLLSAVVATTGCVGGGVSYVDKPLAADELREIASLLHEQGHPRPAHRLMHVAAARSPHAPHRRTVPQSVAPPAPAAPGPTATPVLASAAVRPAVAPSPRSWASLILPSVGPSDPTGSAGIRTVSFESEPASRAPGRAVEAVPPPDAVVTVADWLSAAEAVSAPPDAAR